MIEQYHSSNVDLESFVNDTVRRYSTYMKEKYIYFWRHSVEHSKKLEFYKAFKDEYSTSDYLHQLRNFNERRNLVKFKVSNQKLAWTRSVSEKSYTKGKQIMPIVQIKPSGKWISFLVSM